MQIVDGLLSRKVVDTSKKVMIACQEKVISTMLQQVLIRHKRQWSWVMSNEVPDGAEVVSLFSRLALASRIDMTWMLYGMSIYQEYDEHSDAMLTYLYKFSKEKEHQERIQRILDIHVPGYTIENQGRYIRLVGKPIVYPDPEHLLVQLTHAGHTGLISLLLGIALVYGKWDIKDTVLHTVHVSIPLLGTIVDRLYVLEHMVAACADIGIFLSFSVQDQSHGQIVQLMIRDWEVLHIFHTCVASHRGSTEASKYTTHQRMKESLLIHIEEETSSRAVYESVECGVVKLLRK